jgi:hypothetical protein
LPVPADRRPIILTNYESVREGKIDVTRFAVASLDEADALRSYGSKTYQTFLPLFESVPYRYRRDGHAEPEPAQGADPLCRVPRHHGHRSGPDPLLPAQS